MDGQLEHHHVLHMAAFLLLVPMKAVLSGEVEHFSPTNHDNQVAMMGHPIIAVQVVHRCMYHLLMVLAMENSDLDIMEDLHLTIIAVLDLEAILLMIREQDHMDMMDLHLAIVLHQEASIEVHPIHQATVATKAAIPVPGVALPTATVVLHPIQACLQLSIIARHQTLMKVATWNNPLVATAPVLVELCLLPLEVAPMKSQVPIPVASHKAMIKRWSHPIIDMAVHRTSLLTTTLQAILRPTTKLRLVNIPTTTLGDS
jgi:hypothetical protein